MPCQRQWSFAPDKKFQAASLSKLQIFNHVRYTYILNVFICLLFPFFTLEGLLDLQELKQDFVIETKQIKIPSYPDAFNPCIIRYQGSLLFSFRARDPLTGFTNIVGFTRLNENFNPIGKIALLKLPSDSFAGEMIQDPRMIIIDDKLYIVYSNTWRMPLETVRRIFIAEIQYDGTYYIAQNPEVFLRFDGIYKNKFEKNWVPFVYNHSLLLSYTINPHKIFQPIFGEKRCETIACTEIENFWPWGEFRGGTQAFLVDEQYLAFFHCSLTIPTIQSDGKNIPHYFMGAYTFEKDPPFALKSISPEIIVGDNFYEGDEYLTWKPLKVVFPCGYVYNEKNIWVAYGRQDHELWIATIDKKKLLQSLIPVIPNIPK